MGWLLLGGDQSGVPETQLMGRSRGYAASFLEGKLHLPRFICGMSSDIVYYRLSLERMRRLVRAEASGGRSIFLVKWSNHSSTSRLGLIVRHGAKECLEKKARV